MVLRREISVRDVKKKAFAGEGEHNPEPYRSSNAISGFTGYLPGLQNTIGASFPTMTKMSRSTADEQRRVLEQSPKRGTGQKATPPPIPPDTDAWGNYKPPKEATRELANLYTSAVHGEDYPSKNRSQQREPQGPGASPLTHSPSRKQPPQAPPRVAGYTGYRPQQCDRFGVSWNRAETRAGAAPASYEQANFSAQQP